MWIPALIALCFSLVQLLAAYYLYKTNKPPNTWDSDLEIWLWGALIPFAIGVYALSRWRSATVFRDGTVELNHPFFIIRRKTRFESNTIWLDVIRKIPSKQEKNNLAQIMSQPKFQQAISEEPDLVNQLISSYWKKMLVIHNRKKCFVLVLNKEDKIDELQNLLCNHYNLDSSKTDYTIRYKGFSGLD